MLADQLDYVVGVDPHRDVHALGVVEVRSGVVVFETTVAADSGGYAEALRCRAARAWAAGVRGRGHRLLRRRPDPLPRPTTASRCSRSAGCAESAARAGRPTRSTLSAPLERARTEAACDAAQQAANARRYGR